MICSPQPFSTPLFDFPDARESESICPEPEDAENVRNCNTVMVKEWSRIVEIPSFDHEHAESIADLLSLHDLGVSILVHL